jgi:D-alanyl-D-alanine dipeptidase
MGTGFDPFHECSWSASQLVWKDGQANKKLLRHAMIGAELEPPHSERRPFRGTPEDCDLTTL